MMQAPYDDVRFEDNVTFNNLKQKVCDYEVRLALKESEVERL